MRVCVRVVGGRWSVRVRVVGGRWSVRVRVRVRARVEGGGEVHVQPVDWRRGPSLEPAEGIRLERSAWVSARADDLPAGVGKYVSA